MSPSRSGESLKGIVEAAPSQSLVQSPSRLLPHPPLCCAAPGAGSWGAGCGDVSVAAAMGTPTLTTPSPRH